MIFFYKIFSVINRKEPEPQFVILAPAPGGNLISAPRLSNAGCSVAFWSRIWSDPKLIGGSILAHSMLHIATCCLHPTVFHN
jgi:hypothetical protein